MFLLKSVRAPCECVSVFQHPSWEICTCLHRLFYKKSFTETWHAKIGLCDVASGAHLIKKLALS